MAKQEITQEKIEGTQPEGYCRYDIERGIFLYLRVDEKHHAQIRQRETYWKNKRGEWIRRTGKCPHRSSNAIIIFATVVNVAVAGLQWRIMIEKTKANQGQLKEMQESSTDTKAITNAAREQARSTTALAESAQGQAESAVQLARAAEKQSEAAWKTADAAGQSSKLRVRVSS